MNRTPFLGGFDETCGRMTLLFFFLALMYVSRFGFIMLDLCCSTVGNQTSLHAYSSVWACPSDYVCVHNFSPMGLSRDDLIIIIILIGRRCSFISLEMKLHSDHS